MGVFERLEGPQEEPEPLTAANPSGVNGYDRGMSFEQATGGVQRDSNGRFAPEGGSHSGRFRGGSSNRGDRASRRRASMARSKKTRDEKEAKKAEAERKKAEAEAKKREREAEKRRREAERRKKEAQRQVLANFSLQISEAVLAGDTIKAAELRVERARKAMEFADNAIERTNAQITLNNAQKALANAREAERRRKEREKRRGFRSRNMSEERRVQDSYNRPIPSRERGS
jgi:hypothetical protein